MGTIWNRTKDPDGYEPDDIIARLHDCINNGKPGLDYSISPRPENEMLLQEYIITEKERINILRGLTLSNYDGWDYSDNSQYPNDIVYLFNKRVSLIPRGKEDADKQFVKLYIKITWQKPVGVLVVISFHD